MRSLAIAVAAVRSVGRAAILVGLALRCALVAFCIFATKGVLASRTRRTTVARRLVSANDFDTRLREAIRRATNREAPSAVIVFEPLATHDDADVVPRLEWASLGAARAKDSVARLGATRFGVLLPDADEATARFIAGRIHRALSAHPDGAVAIAVGVATVDASQARGTWPATVIGTATRALHRSLLGRSGIHPSRPLGTELARTRAAS